MARRSIWNGAISFGMVVIPVKLYTATESKDIAFVTLHGACNTRIRQKRFCPFHETEVEMSEIVRAYEYAKEQYLVMDQADFDNLPVASTRTIEIVRFIDLADIDPLYFERSYALEPDQVALKPFYLLKRALETTQRVAIAKVSLRQKEHLCCLRPYEQGIVLETMYYTDEIRGTLELNLPESSAMVTDQEMSMAITLIDHLTGSFEPDQYQDGYRETFEKVIEAKLTTGMPVIAAPAAPTGKVGDLMEALKASIAAAKKERPAPAVVPPAEEEPKGQAAPRKARQRAA